MSSDKVLPLNVGAIASGPALGSLDDDEMRVLGERVIRYYGFDTRILVEKMIHELAQHQRQRRS